MFLPVKGYVYIWYKFISRIIYKYIYAKYFTITKILNIDIWYFYQCEYFDLSGGYIRKLRMYVQQKLDMLTISAQKEVVDILENFTSLGSFGHRRNKYNIWICICFFTIVLLGFFYYSYLLKNQNRSLFSMKILF